MWTVTTLLHNENMSRIAASATTVDFAATARTLTRYARGAGLVGPSFRCPPRLVGVDRSIRRRGETAIVSVRLRGRPWVAVLADMIEGVIAANRLGAPQADRLRSELWDACGVAISSEPRRDDGKPRSDEPRTAMPQVA
jgi:hypothetical protein